MSDMKTFTVRQLDRKPALVLDTCDREGTVRIRRRDGRSYTVRAEDKPTGNVPWRQLVAEHQARIAQIFPQRLRKSQIRKVDQLIGGE
jgi:hypothetical protein